MAMGKASTLCISPASHAAGPVSVEGSRWSRNKRLPHGSKPGAPLMAVTISRLAKKNGSAYGCLIAFGAYQDLGLLPPDPFRIAQCMDSLETPDGAWSNEPSMVLGSTTATSAMISLYRTMQLPAPPASVDWLVRQCLPAGGFLAVPGAPIPDLLSTAVALHALSNQADAVAKVKEPCLDFIDSLWSAAGGFHGNWTDDMLDPEYTYYGLLALGHLAL